MSDEIRAIIAETAANLDTASPDSAAADSADTSSDSDSGSQIAEAADTGGSDQASTEPVTDPADALMPGAAAKPPTEAEKAAAEAAEIDQLLDSLDKGGKRENRLPHSRVKQMVARARERAKADHDAALKTHTDKIGAYEARLQQVGNIETLIFDQPERFIGMLKRLPAYAGLLGGQAAAERRETISPDAEMPQPDGQDGSYTMQGLRKLLDWQAAQTEKRVTERYRPMAEAYEGQQRLNAAIPGIRQQLAEAQSWELFSESQDEILAALREDSQQAERLGRQPSLSLEGAYRKAVFPKLRANRDTMRADLLKEINEKPRSTSTQATIPAAPAKSDEEKSLRDIIAEEARRLR
jgi:hypothetical protein